MEEVIEIVWNATPPPSPESRTLGHYEQLRSDFLSNLVIQSTGEVIAEKEIQACQTEHDLVSLLEPRFNWVWTPDHQTELERFQKSCPLSTRFREKANEAYKLGDFKTALRGYTLAVTFGPNGSPELGLAYANRSALLVVTKHFTQALQDIDHALSNNFPDQLRPKLEERRAKCIISNNNQNQTEHNKDKAETEKYFTSNFFQVKNPNAQIPNAENWVEIDYRADRGRRLIATKSVEAGTVILIDKPFVSVYDNLLAWDFQHCHFCYKPLFSGLPCTQCTFTVYCDEDCRRRACEDEGGWHRYEHFYLAYLPSLWRANIIRHRELQALRIMTILGFEKLQNLFKLNNGRAIYQERKSLYNSSSYETMYNLISHGLTSGSVLEKVGEAFQALFLTNLLFQTVPPEMVALDGIGLDEFKVFTATLVLRHLGNIKYNAIALSKLEVDETTGRHMSVPFSTAVYPLMSLLNHSCDPNAAPIKKFGHLKTSLITLRNVSAGEELCITYKQTFILASTKERQAYLLKSYNFFCTCPACLNNWSGKSVKVPDDVQGALVFNKSDFCLNCQGNTRPCEKCVRHCLTALSEIDVYEDKLREIDALLKTDERCDYVEAMESLKPALAYFTKYFSSCYSLNQVALDLFKKLLVKMVNKIETV